jgi:RsiW-degrading membrane proteinase PrsW (M82 family)
MGAMTVQSKSQILLGSVLAILIIFQIVSVIFLWSISTVGLSAEQLFALFLGADILAFAMVSYVYRSLKEKESPRMIWLLAGSGMLVVLMVSGALL